MNNCKIQIKGMHCRSCEILIEDGLLGIPGVAKAEVNHTTGEAEIFYKDTLDEQAVRRAVEGAGYSLGEDETPYLSKNLKDYQELGFAVFIAVALYLIAKNLGLFSLGVGVSGNYSNLAAVLLIGLTAGVSTCMALVGGLILGASARFAEKHPGATGLQKFKPHIFFNIGRIASYFILGGLIGAAGSFFQLSVPALGIMTVAVGMIMLLLGGQLLEIFPFLKKVSFTLPKVLNRMLGIKDRSSTEYSHKNSMIMGGLTFFLPCGFTQAMQLYAISTGSPVSGALTMGIFAIGTAPGLLTIGGLTSIVRGASSRVFFKTVGVIVMTLAFFNLNNGLNLLGIKSQVTEFLSVFVTPAKARANVAGDTSISLVNGKQEVRMRQDGSGYTPNYFTIRKGIPVRWVITSEDSYTCAASILSQSLGIRMNLKSGENVIEFTPSEVGTIRFSCTMGMYTGSFNVVDGKDEGRSNSDANLLADNRVAANSPQTGGSCGKGGGCGCGAGKIITNSPDPNLDQVQENQGPAQIIKATYNSYEDINPKEFTVKVNKPVRLEIEAKDDGVGCMGSITVPGLTNKIDVFSKGRTTTFEFTPKKTGSFEITCAMGVPRGQIKVI